MPNAVLAPPGQLPLSTSVRLDDPAKDVIRRAVMSYLKFGGDPSVMPSGTRSTIEQHGGLYYVVLRAENPVLPPLEVYRLFNDLSLKIMHRYPRAIKNEIENAERKLSGRTTK